MKKILWIVLLIISLLSAYAIITLKDFSKATDISLYPIKNINKQYTAEKTWLMSYASHGVHIQNQNTLNMSASITKAFDVVVSYQSHHIDPEYYENHKEILSQERGGGYWLWKPYFILKTLEMMPENDILLYVDQSTILRDSIHDLLNSAIQQEQDITAFPNFHNNRQYIKKIIIDRIMNGDDSILDKPQLDAASLLIRNTTKTRKLMREWLYYSEYPELITDIPNEDEYSDFIENRHDQAILTALYYKNIDQFNLYKPYPAIKDVLFKTRRRDHTCSLLYTVFGKELDIFKKRKLARNLIHLKACH